MVLVHRHISNLRLDLSICRLYSALVSTKVLHAAAPANWVSADTLHVPLEPSRGWPETFLQRKPIQSVLPLFLLQRQSSSGSSIWQQHLTRIQKTQVRIQAGSQCLFSPSNNSANITFFSQFALGLFLAVHLNVLSLEVWPRLSSHFQWIASPCISSVWAYSNFTVNFYDHFLSKAILFLTKLSL